LIISCRSISSSSACCFSSVFLNNAMPAPYAAGPKFFR
jgi:hypothetical protein